MELEDIGFDMKYHSVYIFSKIVKTIRKIQEDINKQARFYSCFLLYTVNDILLIVYLL